MDTFLRSLYGGSMNLATRTILFCSALLVVLSGCSSCPFAPKPKAEALRQALTFHASFDHGADADFAQGDRRVFTAPAMNKRSEGKPGLNTSNVTFIAKGEGRFGDAIRFSKKQAPLVYYQAAGNVSYATNHWSGTVSFWLNTDPAGELEPGFCDPIQITPRAWNDAAFFVEFEKRQEIPFRLGVYPDFKVWNPTNRKWEEVPASDKPLVTVNQPPFARGKWTHVVFTFENFNTRRADGVARLYLDGAFRGQLSPREQTFTWDPAATAIMLGLSYRGLMDELSVFDRALTEREIQMLNKLPKGAADLLK